MNGAERFNEFSQAIEGISPRMLTERLRDLEDAGLLERARAPDSSAECRNTASPLAAAGSSR